MRAAVVSTDWQVPYHFRHLMQRICGHPREFSLEHQLLNWLTFFGAFFAALNGLENTFLGLSPTGILFLGSVLISVAYYHIRIRRSVAATWPVVTAVFGAYVIPVTGGWFGSDGVGGSGPMFLLMGVLLALSIYRGKSRWFAAILLVLEFAGLTVLQLVNPQLIQPYPSVLARYVDLTYSFGVLALYGIGYIWILTHNLDERRRQADQLLLNTLPRSIAEQLKYEPVRVIAKSVPQASVLFADVVNFTSMSADMSGSAVVELLNDVFSSFDALVEQRGLEKIKTIGDCYMVAAGVPEPRGDHAMVLADLALELQRYVHTTHIMGRQLSLRIGINSGPVVAGVIGRKKFLYDLWGDTVNMASRMESHGLSGRIQVTEATYLLIREQFVCEPRGTIPIKGKGDMPVWFVLGRAQR